MTETAVRTGEKAAAHVAVEPFDVEKIRADFPILREMVDDKPLVFLDSAASAQKPRAAMDAERDCLEHYYANVHRGVHHLSVLSTEAYEKARASSRRFVNAEHLHEIIFVRGTTEAINLVAQTYGRRHLGPGDEVLLTEMEHHSNIVPWQLICEERGAKIVVAPINDRGELMMEEYEAKLSDRTKIVAATHVSNALGTINPIREMAAMAHSRGAVILVDGAQAAPHLPIDVVDLDCDFYTVSGHKAFAPGGVGLLYGKESLLNDMPPYQGGGEMILTVSFEKTVFNELPHKFEAGTPHIAGAIGMGAALEYLMGLERDGWLRHEHGLLEAATEMLTSRGDVSILGTAENKSSLVSFVLDGVHAHDVGTILDAEGVAVRTGHHCAQPVMEHFGVAATIRASFALYNTLEEVEALSRGLDRVRKVFG
jgi:cysteine desulfurase/selenocysteine lyase